MFTVILAKLKKAHGPHEGDWCFSNSPLGGLCLGSILQNF